ncbi:hypothetical protein ABB37_07281, partial [Leptomonas pyrrhocoris]
MDRFFKKASSSEAAQAKEEVELMQQKVKTMGDVVAALESQLNEEKSKYTQLTSKTTQWKEKVKALTEADRSRIAQLEAELSVFQAAQEANGGVVTPEVQAAIHDALQSASANNASATAGYKETISSLKNTVATKDAQIEELQQELETVKAVYLETQVRFAEEVQSATEHHETEMNEMRIQLASLKEMETLKVRLQEQREEIASLENHSHQQSHIVVVLQQELDTATGHNKDLEQQLQSLRESLSTLEQKQSVWKEKVMQMKAKDNDTIKQLETELAQSRESSVARQQPITVSSDAVVGHSGAGASPTDASMRHAEHSDSSSQPQDQLQQLQIQLDEERLTHRQFEEKLDTWKQKAKQIRFQDAQTITELQNQCDHLQQQLTAQRQQQPSSGGPALNPVTEFVESPLGSRVNLQLVNVQNELNAAQHSRDEMEEELRKHAGE